MQTDTLGSAPHIHTSAVPHSFSDITKITNDMEKKIEHATLYRRESFSPSRRQLYFARESEELE